MLFSCSFLETTQRTDVCEASGSRFAETSLTICPDGATHQCARQREKGEFGVNRAPYQADHCRRQANQSSRRRELNTNLEPEDSASETFLKLSTVAPLEARSTNIVSLSDLKVISSPTLL